MYIVIKDKQLLETNILYANIYLRDFTTNTVCTGKVKLTTRYTPDISLY